MPSLLDPKLKFREHIIELVLVFIVIVLTGVYLNMDGVIPSRAIIMAIPFGIKSMVIIGYQMLTEHTMRFSKWASSRANLILNSIEPVFWLTLLILKFMGISESCSGASCGVSWVTALFIMAILALTVHVLILTIVERRHHTTVPAYK